jgi:hypothetical protein
VSRGAASRAGAWNRFWHPRGPTVGLGLFRILFAYCLWREVATTRAKSTFAIEGGFHLGYVPFIKPVPEDIFHWMQDTQLLFIPLLALGVLTRTSCAILLGLSGWVYFADQLNFRNHPYFFLLLLALLLLSPADESLSLRSVVRMVRERRPSVEAWIGRARSLTFQRAMQVQVSIAYLLAGFHKLNPGFLNGSVLDGYVSGKVDDWGADLTAWLGPDLGQRVIDLMLSDAGLVAAAWGSAVAELVLPFALWFRKTRPAAIAVGIAFHATIAFTMNIHTFSYAMLATYLLFLDPETLPRWMRAAAGLVSGRSRVAARRQVTTRG